MLRRYPVSQLCAAAFLFAICIHGCLSRTFGADAPSVNGALRQCTPSSRRSPFIISEIMYHPLDRTDGVNL